MKEPIVGNCVLTCRKALSVTQQDLADAVGVTRQTIIAIEKGTTHLLFYLRSKSQQSLKNL